jgi:hypothetical protein
MMAHPYFTSGLTWHTRLDEAVAAASAAHKRIMLVVGKPLCGGSRNLVERTLQKEELEAFTPEKFVLLAADADAMEPRVAEIVGTLPVRAPTPLIAYLSVDGRVLGSTAGGRPPAVLLNDMLGATAKS